MKTSGHQEDHADTTGVAVRRACSSQGRRFAVPVGMGATAPFSEQEER